MSEEPKKRKKNYCFDECPFNLDPRKDGRLIVTNKGLNCAAGFTQTVSSAKALRNAVKNGAQICARLHRRFKVPMGGVDGLTIKS